MTLLRTERSGPAGRVIVGDLLRVKHSWIVPAAQVCGFCMLTALLAQVRIPLPGTPVPMTLQALAVLLAGYFLPVRRAVAALGLYLGVGSAGVPVFAPGSLGLFGPTGGYIVAFVIAAGIVAVLRGSSLSVGRLLVAGAAGTAVILAVGVTWYAVYTGGSVSVAIAGGLLPFVPKAVVQLGAAVAIVRVVALYRPRPGTAKL